MQTTKMIICAGPESYINRINDEKLPEWYVFAANDDHEPTGKVYHVRKSFDQATRLATRMAVDRRLPLEMEASPA